MKNTLLAQLTNPVLPPALGQGAKEQGGVALGGLIGALIGFLFIVAFLIALFFLITGGISWVTSAGDKSKLEVARDKITNAIVGLIIVAGVWAIMTVIAPFLGFEAFPELPLPTIEDLI
ncbi:hypothetical protein ACFL1A_01630 [Patescibacteria group bacterium]